MTPYEEELLTILQEECAEVVHQVCKIRRFGLYDCVDITNKEKLTQEVGDTLAMVHLLVDAGVLDADEIFAGAERKLEKLKLWMKNKKD